MKNFLEEEILNAANEILVSCSERIKGTLLDLGYEEFEETIGTKNSGEISCTLAAGARKKNHDKKICFNKPFIVKRTNIRWSKERNPTSGEADIIFLSNKRIEAIING